MFRRGGFRPVPLRTCAAACADLFKRLTGLRVPTREPRSEPRMNIRGLLEGTKKGPPDGGGP